MQDPPRTGRATRYSDDGADDDGELHHRGVADPFVTPMVQAGPGINWVPASELPEEAQ